jgi:hypothetical protein
MFINFLYGIFDEGVALHLFLRPLENEIDFFLILARGIILLADRLLVPGYLLP